MCPNEIKERHTPTDDNTNAHSTPSPLLKRSKFDRALDATNTTVSVTSDPSILMKKLRSNISNDELSTLKEQLLNAQQHLKRLTSQSSEFAHESDVASLTRFIELAESLLAPVRKLPVEVLSEILLMSVPEVSFTPYRLDVMQVCAYWRSICIGQKKLWTKIHLRLPLSEEDTKRDVETVSDYLARSGENSKLFVSIGNYADNRGCVACPPDVIDKLVARANQWETFTCPRPHILSQDNISGIRENVSQLKVLNLGAFSTSAANAASFDAFSVAPSLNNVTLFGNPNVLLPWKQITELVCEDLDCLISASQCTSLQRLEMRNIRPILEPHSSLTIPNPPIYTFPSLKFLCLETQSHTRNPSLGEAFLAMQMSSLSILHIKCSTDDDDQETTWPQEEFKTMLSYCAESLTELALFNVHMNDTQLLQILGLLPNITRLILHQWVPYEWGESWGTVPPAWNQFITENLLHGLSKRVSNNAPMLVPLVEYLELEYVGDVDVDEAFIELLEARARTLSFTRVDFRTRRKAPMWGIERLRRLAKLESDGMQIYCSKRSIAQTLALRESADQYI